MNPVFPRAKGMTYRVLLCLYENWTMTLDDLARECGIKTRVARDLLHHYPVPDVCGKRTLPQYLIDFFRDGNALSLQKQERRMKPAAKKFKRPTQRHTSGISWFVGTSI